MNNSKQHNKDLSQKAHQFIAEKHGYADWCQISMVEHDEDFDLDERLLEYKKEVATLIDFVNSNDSLSSIDSVEDSTEDGHPNFHLTKFKVLEYENGMHFPKELFIRAMGWKCSFNLSVKYCTYTDIRMLYRIIKDQLAIEERLITDANGDVHQLQHGVVEFFQNILTEMKHFDGVEDLASFIIKTR